MLKDIFFPKAEHMTLSGIKGDIQVTSYIKVYCTLHGYRNIIEKVICRNIFEKLCIF
jgi:hypothetical protein